MDRDEKYLLRIMFQNKIYSSDGQVFEDLFTKIMSYKCPSFKAVKPQGRFGDMKNDGYILDTGIFYQVYGPEDISKSIVNAISKLQEDLDGLLNKWSKEVNIKEFYYVVNDKYKGAQVVVHKKIIEIKNIIRDLGKEKTLKTGLIVAKDLENILFELDEDSIIAIVVKNKFKELYTESKEIIKEDEVNYADRRYMHILEKSMPKNNNNSIQQAVECLMAFYFESCDIFEIPES